MPTIRKHPRRDKRCVFCKYWMGDAGLKYVNSSVGFEYERDTLGKCLKRNINHLTYFSCFDYSPSIDAEKIL